MDGLTTWYLIIALAVLVIALLARFSTYTFLVRMQRQLPESAGKRANITFLVILVLGLGMLLVKGLFFSR